jgi:urease accessory protein
VLAPGRITLLRSQAGPLAGDHDRVEIVVESGTLTIEPIAATIALPGPRQTVLELDVTLGDGAHLELEDAPLVVAEGADVVRTTTIRLGEGASATVRDLVVLGRAGEGRGRLESLLRIEGPEGVILHDALRIEPGADDAYVALAPGHRAVGTLVSTKGTQGAFSRHEALEAGGFLRRMSAVSAADVRLR